MSRINSTWRQYFEDYDEGVGTTYERFILHKYFERIKGKYSVLNLLEAPSFGMTGISGINSMWWSFYGARVTVVDNNKERINLIKEIWGKVALDADFICIPSDQIFLPFKEKSFDMSWNFAALGFVHSLEKFLKELARVTKSVIFICLPNKANLAYIIRSRILESEPMNNVHARYLTKIMAELNWRIEEAGYFDVPPWPDIAMKKEDLLRDLGFKWVADRFKNKGDDGLCILNYFNGENKRMGQKIENYAFLEHAPWIFKKVWAHHQYFVFTPQQDSTSPE